MISELLVAAAAATGTYLCYTATFDQSPQRSTPPVIIVKIEKWLAANGLGDTARPHLLTMSVGAFFLAAFLAWVMFGGLIAPALTGALVAFVPVTTLQARRRRAAARAAEEWPRMIDEIRLMCGSLGKPIPQALLEVGKKGPVEYRAAFVEAEREWLLSTDFERTLTLLRTALADATADVVCETLAVAHGVGGTDIDRRLAALSKDRHADLQGRKDARSKQAGVMFARRFVLVVPLGMAGVGMTIGNGRAAYETTGGQLGVAAALLILAACWIWAGRLIRIPQPQRAFRA